MSKPTPAADTPRAPTPVLSVSPVVLPAPGRAVDLQVRVSAPVTPMTGSALPILLLSHGHGPSNHLSSLNGYAPLASYWAAHGFVVIQPTHLDSKTLPFRSSDHPDAPLFWRARAEDMKRILDQLDAIEDAVAGLAGRLDRSKVAVVGHSMGGHTASVLLGARHKDPHDGTEVSLAEPRIKAGVLLAAPGRGDTLSKLAAEKYPFFSTIDFSTMTTPALVVAGDKDDSPHLTVAGADWHADPYFLSPGPKSLLTLFDAGHGLGGVSGYDVAETTDENPERVAAVQLLTWAYLRTALYPGDSAWQKAQDALTGVANPLGRVATREAKEAPLVTRAG
ncbi:alpha/beta hydrolase family protein [Chondromyces apiculatus]|nr:alpha/beta fold hydrolase [Chondromyces apiculatus]